MNEKLIAGYAAYTDADEFGATTLGDAPATIELVSVSLASAASVATAAASVAATVDYAC
ncbi:LxmA leader domain family RiPP [Streptomyces sp. NPDC102473]|uniref:LxmA leader domain family RiPP n=1 Tax=Streptomyces sp. NPDC102473 TaxID=3366180 RepID=UPI00381CC36B